MQVIRAILMVRQPKMMAGLNIVRILYKNKAYPIYNNANKIKTLEGWELVGEKGGGGRRKEERGGLGGFKKLNLIHLFWDSFCNIHTATQAINTHCRGVYRYLNTAFTTQPAISCHIQNT